MFFAHVFSRGGTWLFMTRSGLAFPGLESLLLGDGHRRLFARGPQRRYIHRGMVDMGPLQSLPAACKGLETAKTELFEKVLFSICVKSAHPGSKYTHTFVYICVVP